MASSNATFERIKKEVVTVNEYVSFLPSPSADSASSVDASGPSLVLLFGWRAGKAAHLLKYAAGVRELYPAANLLIFRTPTKYYFASSSAKETILKPAVNYIKESIQTAGENYRGTLVYVLSSGGGFHLMAMRKVLRSASTFPTRPTAPTALILDSSPGAPGLEEAVTSAAPSNLLLRFFAVPPILMFYGMFYLFNASYGNYPISYELRTSLNSVATDDGLAVSLKPPLLPNITPENPTDMPRLYIYSPADTVTPSPKLEEHMAEAVEKGFDVQAERFSKSAHVAHVREDPDKYWAAVRRLWEYAVEKARVRATL